MTNAVQPVRFGAWVLKNLAVQKGLGDQINGPATINLVLRPESAADFKYPTLPGLTPGTVLTQPDVTLTLFKDGQDGLKLTGNYVTREQYTYKRATYRKEWVPAGRDMCDNWESAHYENRYDGDETVSATRAKPEQGTVKVATLLVFKNLYNLLDSLKVEKPLLVEAALRGVKGTPELSKAFKSLKAETEPLQKLVLTHQINEPPLKQAFEADTPLLKQVVLQPVTELLGEQGKKLAKVLRQEAKSKVQDLREALRRTRTSLSQEASDLQSFTRRVTGQRNKN